MNALRRLLFHASYQLRSHHWNGWPLDIWLSIVLVLVAILAWVRILPGRWGAMMTAAAVLVLMWVVTLWAQRDQHVTFSPQGPASDPGPSAPLTPTDKIEVRATGRFEVEGKEQRFCEVRAYFRTFATREHVVMAIVPPSRVLAVGARPPSDVGMWYIFFHPHQILELAPGALCFERTPRSSLRVVYQAEKRRETLYLSFDDPATRQQVWADLQQDAVAAVAHVQGRAQASTA